MDERRTTPAAGTDDRWATSPEMNPLEAMMWRAEVDPRLRSTIVVAGLLDTAPEWSRLVEAHEWASRLVPRLRQRVVEPSFGLGHPTWAVDRELDLDAHLRRVELGGPTDGPALMGLAEQLAAAPFDRTRPLWEAVLVDGLDDGRAVYLLKMHHTLTDGLGLVQLLDLLAARSPAHDADKAWFDAPAPDAPSSPLLLVRQLAGAVRDAPGELTTSVRSAAGRTLRGIAHPLEALADVAAFTGSALRLATGPSVPGSPLLAARSTASEFVSHEVGLAELKAAAAAGGGSLNDAFLTALLGGYRRYHERFGEVPEEIPMGMPVSLRGPDDEPGGNLWAGTRLVAPVAEADPVRRMARVHAAVAAVVAERVRDGIGLVAPLLSMLPPALLARIQGDATAGNDLQASNVRGVDHPVFLAGSELLRAHVFAPRPGCAAMVTLVSHDGTCCIAATLDPAAITRPDLFARCLREGFDEVLALGRT